MPSYFSIRPHVRRLLVPEGEPVPTGFRVVRGFVALNLLLFVPFYFVLSGENGFWPFFPLGHPRGPYDWEGPGLGRSIYEYGMQLFVRRHNLDIFRVSADWVFILSSLIVLSRVAGHRRLSAVSLAWGGYACLLAFLAYSAFISDLRAQPGALIDDVLLLESAWIFVRDTWVATYWLYVSAIVGGIGVAGVMLARFLNRVWRWRGGSFRAQYVVTGWVLVNLYCVTSTSWFGVERDDPVIQLQSKHVLYNWQRSRNVLAAVGALNTALERRPAVAPASPAPNHRPDIYLFEVESYGAAWWLDAEYDVARRGLVDRVSDEMNDLELSILSRFATAPVHGGGSWMSTASVLSGLRIDTQSVYSAWKRLAGGYPHLVSYLNKNGYYTLAVQSGTTWTEDIYGYDEMIIRKDFAYDGPFYGFGGVPDQWALDYAFTHPWNEHARPRLFHFFAVSTHFAWLAPPRITEEVAQLRGPQTPFIQTHPLYAELARTVPDGLKQDYFVTLAYEWELLLDVFRHRVEPGFIALIFGDHQAPFITDGYGGDDVALHVVTDIPRYAGLLADAGFAVGAEPAPEPSGVTSWRMEGFYSFLLSLLTTPEGAALEFNPNGIDLAALGSGH